MTSIYRFVNVLEGFAGGPGVNVLHFSAGSDILGDQHVVDSAYANLQSMYGDMSSYLAPEVSVTVDTTVSVIDVATGELTGVVNVSDPGSAIGSTSTSNLAPRGVAALVQMPTNIFRNGRRLAGRMFLGPYSDDGLDSLGGIPTAGADNIIEAFSGMVSLTGPRLCVYSRPKPIKVGGVVTGYTEGYYGDVENVSVPHRASYLRGRNG